MNCLKENDLVLMVETGHFASLWEKMANKIGIKTEILQTDWRRGVDPNLIEERLLQDKENKIKAVCIVHNETSTGSTSNIREVREVLDHLNHDALLMVDTISGLASMNYEHDYWGVEVTISGSQKGLMLPPGLSFNAISKKALSFIKLFSKFYYKGIDFEKDKTSQILDTSIVTQRKFWDKNIQSICYYN